jgi:hypothetical protein
MPLPLSLSLSCFATATPLLCPSIFTSISQLSIKLLGNKNRAKPLKYQKGQKQKQERKKVKTHPKDKRRRKKHKTPLKQR